MDALDKKDKPSSVVIALVLAIVSLVLSPVPIVNNFAFFLALLAIIFGIVGYRKTRKVNKSGRKTVVIALVLAVIAGATVLVSQAFYGNSLDKAGKDIQSSLDKASGKKTSDLLGKDVLVTFGSFEATPNQYSTDTQLPVKVTNKNKESKSYSVQVEAVDKSGNRIAEETVYANSLGSNQSQDFKAFQYVASDKVEALKTATFKVASVSQY